jgi:hypothetical protein
MLLLNLDTKRALESVNELLPVFALVAALSPSAYVRGAIFQLMTVSTYTVTVTYTSTHVTTAIVVFCFAVGYRRRRC